MAQISLYIDDVTLKKIEKAAKIEHKSISKWVSSKLSSLLSNSWPENYDSLFGAITDETFIIEKPGDFEGDYKREEF